MKRWIYHFFYLISSVSFASPQGTLLKEEQPVIILGSGVAALTAATYLARAGVTPLVIEGETMGGAITQSQKIQNWPGEIEITGSVLADKLYAQAKQNGALFLKEKAVKVDFSKSPFIITTEPLLGGEQKRLKTKTCIIALGSTPKQLNIPGEKQYWSQGVYSCALCDGSLYKDQVVGVVGGGDAALVDAEYLASLAKRVYLIVRADHLKGVELKRIEALKTHPKVTILYNTVVKEVIGSGDHVTAATLENSVTRETVDLPLEALFVKIGSLPSSQLFQGQLELDPAGYIVLKEGQETSVRGVFAAGDVADAQFQQAICASGDGAKAAIQTQRGLFSARGNPLRVAGEAPKKQEEVIEVSSLNELQKVIESGDHGPIFIDFYSTRCPPCRAFASHYETWAHDFQEKIRFVKVNADTGKELFYRYGIQAIPSLIILDEKGALISKKVGLQEISDVDQKLKMCQSGLLVDPLLFKSIR